MKNLSAYEIFRITGKLNLDLNKLMYGILIYASKFLRPNSKISLLFYNWGKWVWQPHNRVRFKWSGSSKVQTQLKCWPTECTFWVN